MASNGNCQNDDFNQNVLERPAQQFTTILEKSRCLKQCRTKVACERKACPGMVVGYSPLGKIGPA